MPRLRYVAISKSAIDALPEWERMILLGAGKILNEINICTKYMQFSINGVFESSSRSKRVAAHTMLSYFLRALSGHVYEGYRFLKDKIRIRRLTQYRSARLDAEFRADVEAIVKHFAAQQPKTFIEDMRRRFAFHTDGALMLQALDDLPSGFEYEIVLGQDAMGDTIYYGSEQLIVQSVHHLGPKKTWDEAITPAFSETLHIATLLGKIFQRLMLVILAERLGLTSSDLANHEVIEGPAIDTVVVPFYCEPPVRAAESKP